MENKAQIICLRSDAYYAMIDTLLAYVDEKYSLPKENKWVDSETACALLNISSRQTLQSFRDEGKINFSRTGKKNILYDRESILQFIESNIKKTF